MPEVRIYSKLCNSVFGLVDISICEQTYIEIYIRHCRFIVYNVPIIYED